MASLATYIILSTYIAADMTLHPFLRWTTRLSADQVTHKTIITALEMLRPHLKTGRRSEVR